MLFRSVMIWVLLTLILLLGLLLWLPIQVEIDTAQQQYEIRWKGIFAFRAEPDGEQWHWFYRLFFWEKEWKRDSRKPDKITAARPPSEKTKAANSKRKMPFSMRQIKVLITGMWRAITVRRLWVNWDTGDFSLNAWLYPAFQFASRGRRQLHINFFGVQELTIFLQTRLGLLAWAGLRAFLTPKSK